MNPAQALLREVRRELIEAGAVTRLSVDLRDAIDEELERADVTASTPEPTADRTDDVRSWSRVAQMSEARASAQLAAASFQETLERVGALLAGHVDPAVMNDILDDSLEEVAPGVRTVATRPAPRVVVDHSGACGDLEPHLTHLWGPDRRWCEGTV